MFREIIYFVSILSLSGCFTGNATQDDVPDPVYYGELKDVRHDCFEKPGIFGKIVCNTYLYVGGYVFVLDGAKTIPVRGHFFKVGKLDVLRQRVFKYYCISDNKEAPELGWCFRK